jgi:flagellar protein FliO/FliZ
MKTINKSLMAVLFGMVFLLFVYPLTAQSVENNTAESESAVSSLDLERSITFSDEPSAINLSDSGVKKSSGSGIGIFVRMIVALVIIVGLIYFVFWFIKKKSNVVSNDDDYLRRVAAINVAPGKSVQVVTLIDKAYLIGVTDDSITLLGEINDDELIKAMNLNADKKTNNKKPTTFSEVLDMFLVKSGKQKNVFSESEQKVDQMFTSDRS